MGSDFQAVVPPGLSNYGDAPGNARKEKGVPIHRAIAMLRNFVTIDGL